MLFLTRLATFCRPACIELITGLHIRHQIAQHKGAAEARATAAAQADRDRLAVLAEAAEPALVGMLHMFVVSMHNDKHNARVRTVRETVHVPGQPQADYWGLLLLTTVL